MIHKICLKGKLILFFYLFMVVFSNCYSQTTIGDSTIYGLATFTKGHSPYILTGNITVKPKGTLSIEAGVQILVSPTASKILVEGKLYMTGTASDSIYLKPTPTSPQSDFYIGRIVETPGGKISLKYLAIENFNNIFRSSIWNTDSLANSRISNCDIGVSGSIRAVNCYITNCRIGKQSGILFASTITNCSETAFLAYADFDIRECTLSYSPAGLKDMAKGSGSSMFRTFKNNVVKNNKVGLEFYTSVSKTYYQFSGNAIAENEKGIIAYSPGEMLADDNNKICHNSIYNIEYTDRFFDLDATGICWCTNDSSAIQSKIYDGRIDQDIAYVDFTDYKKDCYLDGVISGVEPSYKSNSQISNVYPNPFDLEINVEGYAGNVIVSDMTGRIQFEGTIEESINTSSWPSGIYFLKAGNIVQKISKQ